MGIGSDTLWAAGVLSCLYLIKKVVQKFKAHFIQLRNRQA
jgi:hypothetical protein